MAIEKDHFYQISCDSFFETYFQGVKSASLFFYNLHIDGFFFIESKSTKDGKYMYQVL